MANLLLPKNLIRFFEQDNIVGWGVKDINSQYIYANKAFKLSQTLPRHFDIEGMKHGELPAPVAEFADIFEQQDRKIENSRLAIRSITTHVHDNKLQPVYAVHEPLINESGECVGTVVSIRTVKIITSTSLLSGMIQQHAIFQPPCQLFTEKEWEIIYLLQCHLSLTEMSHVLSTSINTLHRRLNNCFKKADVNSITALLEYCAYHHYDGYIPQYFLKKLHLIITS